MENRKPETDYFTTMLTSLSGTTITLTTCLPSSRLDLGVTEGEFFERLARRSESDVDTPAQFAVHLDHHFCFFFARELWIILGP